MSWTDERVETLKRMWAEGQSASQIAKELGGVTRNAVIGKVHRLGLSNRVIGDAAKPSSADPVAEAPAPRAADLPEPEDVVRPAVQPERPRPVPVAQPAAPAEPAVTPEPDDTPDPEPRPAPPVHQRRAIIPAGQPLPPQPSANEVSPEALATVREVEKKARRLTLMELTERTCKWPIGDPATDDFWFCGLPTQQGKPYCEAHVGLAFQPMSSRRDRRR
jgi:GcrA cell cycle regulator